MGIRHGRKLLMTALLAGGLQGRAAVTSADPGQQSITWEVVDRFRLLKSVRGRDVAQTVFQRFVELYENLGEPVSPWLPPETKWNEESLDYERAYTDVDRWIVRLDAPFSGTCDWTFQPAGNEVVRATGPCRGFRDHEFGPGETSVSAVSTDASHQKAEAKVAPRDVLVVSLGDSYASGEGVPDLGAGKPAGKLKKLNVLGYHDAFWMDDRCHRSLFSGPSLAALEYAVLNRHVSVTHLSFACSGATLNHKLSKGSSGFADGGILLPYSGVVRRGPVLRPQVEQLKAALAGHKRDVDFLTITIGGNDLGFGEVVEKATLSSVAAMKKSMEKWQADAEPRFSEVQMKLLRDGLLDAHGMTPGVTTVVVNDYPDPTAIFRLPPDLSVAPAETEQLNEICGGRRDGEMRFAPPFTIHPDKVKIMREGLMENLRLQVAKIRSSLGGVGAAPAEFEVFNRHGYCASALNQPGVPQRWINTLPDSVHLLSKRGYPAGMISREARTGAMHPNIRGQAEFARLLLRKILDVECKKIPRGDSEFELFCGPEKRYLEKIPGGLAQ